MKIKSIWSLLATGLLVAASATSRAADIIDEGHFFSPEALASANQTIRELEKAYHHQIHIETYATVPEGKVDAVAHIERGQERHGLGAAAPQDRLPAGAAQPCPVRIIGRLQGSTEPLRPAFPAVNKSKPRQRKSPSHRGPRSQWLRVA